MHMAGCNGAYALEGCFNLTRQYVASNGSLANPQGIKASTWLLPG